MAEFVDENGRAEQYEHGRYNINNGQNSHVKKCPCTGTD
jgi:hypothetical protein